MIGDLLNNLAIRMRTGVVRQGKVTPLVAHEWYDDGAIDLGNRFPCLEEGSASRKALPRIPLSAVVPLFESAFAPVPLNSLTLPLVLDLPEFESRPELVRPLMPLIERRNDLSAEAVVRAADLAHRARALQDARRVLRMQTTLLDRRYAHFSYLPDELFERILSIDPITALRVIRATRSRRVRKDEQEDGDRRQVLAKISCRIGTGFEGKEADAAP